MTIKFLASNLTSDLVNNFNDTTAMLTLITKNDQSVEFFILNRDTLKSSIEL